MEAIVAVYADNGIGDGTTQPVTLRADRQHFKALTDGAAVVCGRKTMEDFPGGRPLKGRNNIILTRNPDPIEGAETAGNVEAVLDAAGKYDRCIVIGGASVYEQLFPYIETVHMTKIDCLPVSRKFFPDLDENPCWECVEESEKKEENGIGYRFCTYRRRADG